MKTEIKHAMGAEYYRDSATPTNPSGWVSKSILWDCFKRRSPYKWKHGKKEKMSDPMIFGILVHAVAFQPSRVHEEFAISEWENFRTKAAQEWRDEQLAAGKIVVSQEQAQRASEMDDVIAGEIAATHGQCQYEVAVYSDVAHKVKGQIDIVPPKSDFLVDLKTTSSIPEQEAIPGMILSRGYHWQAAMYLDLYNAATGECRDKFELLLIETEAPYETARVILSEKMIESGRLEYQIALDRWAYCVSKNRWQKRIDSCYVADLPAWYKPQ